MMDQDYIESNLTYAQIYIIYILPYKYHIFKKLPGIREFEKKDIFTLRFLKLECTRVLIVIWILSIFRSKVSKKKGFALCCSTTGIVHIFHFGACLRHTKFFCWSKSRPSLYWSRDRTSCLSSWASSSWSYCSTCRYNRKFWRGDSRLDFKTSYDFLIYSLKFCIFEFFCSCKFELILSETHGKKTSFCFLYFLTIETHLDSMEDSCRCKHIRSYWWFGYRKSRSSKCSNDEKCNTKRKIFIHKKT